MGVAGPFFAPAVIIIDSPASQPSRQPWLMADGLLIYVRASNCKRPATKVITIIYSHSPVRLLSSHSWAACIVVEGFLVHDDAVLLQLSVDGGSRHHRLTVTFVAHFCEEECSHQFRSLPFCTYFDPILLLFHISCDEDPITISI